MSIAERDRMIFEQAKEMRSNPTKTELKMIKILNEVTPKVPYICQYVVPPYYTLDFYFQTLGICIEVDGKSHFGRRKNDIKRDAYLLEMKGIVTYRFSNSDVLYNPQMVGIISEILQSLCDVSLPQGNYCPDCGAKREADFIFCGNCGRRLSRW